MAQAPSTSKSKTLRWKSYAFMLLNTIVWAVAFILVKPAFEVTTPFRYLFYRYVIAVIVSLPILFHYLQRFKLTWKMVWNISWIETIGVLTLSFVYWGLNYTSAIEAGLLTSSLPIFIIFGGIWLLGEKEEGHEWQGLVIAALGTLLLTLIPLFTNQHQRLLEVSLLGNILILLHNLANMIYFPMIKKHYAHIPKLLATSLSFYIGLIFFFVLSLIEVGSFSELVSSARVDLSFSSVWVASGYMAIFGSIIGLTAYIKGQNGIEASEAALFWYLQPLIYLPLAVIILGEQLTVWHLIGLALTTAGVYLAERRVHRRPATIKSKP